MYILVDIIAVLFVLGLTIYGLKSGFCNSTVNLLLVIICFGGSIALAGVTVIYGFEQLGWVDEITALFASLLGNSKIQGGQEIVNLVANYLGIGLLVLICAIIYGIVLNILRKLLLKAFKKLNEIAFFGAIDKTLGCLVNFVISAGLVLTTMAFIHAFEDGGIVFTYANEVLRASEILSFFNDINPLNALFENSNVVETIQNLFI